MMKYLIAVVAFILSIGSASAQRGASGTPDPFYLIDQASINYICNGSWDCNSPYNDTTGRTVQTAAINTSVKNLILLVAGQSNNESEAPSAYTPTNGTKIDNFNIVNGQLYVAQDPQLGTSWNPTGPGTMAFRIADTLITNGKFDRVILVPMAIGGTGVYQWGLGNGFAGYNAGTLYTRPCTAMARLAARGIVPGMTNVTFALDWGQGETDSGQGTTQLQYYTNLSQVISKLQSCGFTGRFFIKLESWIGGSTSAAVRAGQAQVVDNVTIFQGGDMDTLNNSYRVDTVHFNDTGVAAAAALEVTAMHASGAPF